MKKDTNQCKRRAWKIKEKKDRKIQSNKEIIKGKERKKERNKRTKREGRREKEIK